MASLSGRSAWGLATADSGASRPSRIAMQSQGGAALKFTVEGASESDLALALQGKLQTSIDAQLKALEAAYWRAMSRVVEAGKGRLRADVIAGGFHNARSLANTWRGAAYPRDKNSLDVAGWIYTRAGMLISVFEEATVIKVAGNAQFLAIPLGPAKAIVRRLQQQKKKGLIGRNAWGRFEKDDSYVEQVARAMGVDLVPIIVPDRQTGVLVPADKRTLTPTGRAAKNQAKAATPLFALAKTATLRKRIRGQALLDEILKNFPSDFVHALMGELAVAQRGDG
ncbi:DUF6441 family protein [Brevundimonas sp.]|uniref:DUF6441 family protein n=1 Tax=Brevundimonas sp. TaxID=1871086 RepID=UPI0025B85DAC|nr:DUF6441 family protein [Brevundimonas sp.]MCG2662568.1 DUF6441 family protein [Brevundimonas sp.]